MTPTDHSYPKVLIIGETFHRFSGGGITLSNLFKDFPKENLAVAANYLIITKSSEEICQNYFCLGKDNYKLKYLPTRFFKAPPSGIYHAHFSKRKTKSSNIIKAVLMYILKKTGIIHNLLQYNLTEEFISWIREFSPDIIFTQLGEYSKMDFVKSIHQSINKPITLHIMDDWLTTAPKCLFGFYWKHKFDRSIKDFLSFTSLPLSISEGMSEEYRRRYNKTFFPFHNPVDIEFWGESYKKGYSIDFDKITIMYSGKLGSTGTSSSFYEIADAIEDLNKEKKYQMQFQIQSTYITKKIARKLNKYSCVKINPVVDYSELPNLYCSVDLLVIPMDFDYKGISYLRYSMLTKSSEFMASGTPIILYAHEQMSMTKHAIEHGWAKVVSKRSKVALKNTLVELFESEKIRKEFGINARKFCFENYDAKKIRTEFKEKLISICPQIT